MLKKEEEEKEQATASPSELGTDSTYGVKSLGESMYNGAPDAAVGDHKDEEEDGEDGHERRRSTLRPLQSARESSSECLEPTSPIQTVDSSPSRHGQPASPLQSMSHSLLSLDSQAPLSSLPSSPKSFSNHSFRPSDEDSMDEGSQAIVSSSEDDSRPSADLRESAPQLIMPSIKMPSRRPFTERGRTMGRLKVLIAGDSGM